MPQVRFFTDGSDQLFLGVVQRTWAGKRAGEAQQAQGQRVSELSEILHRATAGSISPGI